MEKNKQKMKIFYLYSSMGPGGAERMMLSIADNLRDYGLENIVICPRNSYLEKEAKRLKLKTYTITIKGTSDFLGILNLLRIVKKEKPDILHVHQGKLFWPSIFVKWLSANKPKLIFHRHGIIRSSFISKRHYRFADRIIAVSKKVAESLIDLDGVLPSKISVVYNGIELNETNSKIKPAELRKNLNISENSIVIGTVGAIHKPAGKGQKYLIKVAEKLKEKYQNLHYLIVGDGSLRPVLERYVRERGLSDIITFTGYRENVLDYMKIMDIFCLLSTGTEGLGLVLLEAQWLGKPVIGTNIGGIPEAFINGITGILIPPHDVNKLQDALITLIENPELRRKMGSAGQNWVSQNFSIKKCCESIYAVYRSLYYE